MKHTIKFALTISVGVIALCLAFLLHEPLWAQILVSLAGEAGEAWASRP